MTKHAWAALGAVRHDFAALVETFSRETPWLGALQDELRQDQGYEDYRIETPVVYNRSLDDLGPGDSYAFILVADNPGKKEQLAANNRYLVGQSGRLAEGFFRDRLGMDFRKDVVILNKSPLHTPKTAELRRLLSLAREKGEAEGRTLEGLFLESQRTMAAMARKLHGASAPKVVLWLSGLGEFGPRGLFRPYAEALGEAYREAPQDLRDRVWLFRHFSMNQFSQEVNKGADPTRPLLGELERIGIANRQRLLGW